MENLKKERSVMRRLFTKAKNELLPILTTNLPKPNIELKEKYNFLAANAENMFKVDKKIKEVWLSMENLDEELYFQDLEAINEYESENKKSTRPVRVGDVVIVETEGKKLDWPLGIVTEVCTGKDGVRRVAKVKTADGERTRAVQRLHPLEINNDEESEVLAKPDKRTTSGRIVRPPKRLDC
ncbi:hypothetical protein JYU34_001228 [Plutella xylostella]|uniref:DUF5641 domain-containing protein n=1 Tax=Plutella xylostella TaxID=51655 RepID=A0ABQ7R6B8_PLUXY|nr:hypothetical protein JYU34_001228 [Plutella xylostella]